MSVNLKLLHWNICQEYYKDTPMCIANEIIKHEPDIIVLTEFLKTPNFEKAIVTPLKQNGFEVIIDKRPYKEVFPLRRKSDIRQVLIALNKDKIESIGGKEHLPDNEDEIRENTYYDTQSNHYPNYLKVSCKVNNVDLIIIGTRIRVLKGSGSEERKFRKAQLNKLLEMLDCNTNTIVLGDFNISEWYNGSDWNFEKDYKRPFEKKGFYIHIPQLGNSPIGSNKAQDHLITSKNISLTQGKNRFPIISYLEDFNGYEWIGLENYPDHAILLASIQISMCS